MFNVDRFKEIIDSFHKNLLGSHDETTGFKPTEEKWSLKEIIGHLVDSASNNHQRFVRLQSGDLLDFPVYDCEIWIKAQKYNSMDWDVLVALWYNYNRLLLHVIENIDEAALQNVWVMNKETVIPLEQLVCDYYKHLEWHIGHFCNRQEELP